MMMIDYIAASVHKVLGKPEWRMLRPLFLDLLLCRCTEMPCQSLKLEALVKDGRICFSIRLSKQTSRSGRNCYVVAVRAFMLSHQPLYPLVL